jgi:hypothetical protein
VSDDDVERGVHSLAWRLRQRRKSSPETPRISALNASLEAAVARHKATICAEVDAPVVSHPGNHSAGAERAADSGSSGQAACAAILAAKDGQQLHPGIHCADPKTAEDATEGSAATADESVHLRGLEVMNSASESNQASTGTAAPAGSVPTSAARLDAHFANVDVSKAADASKDEGAECNGQDASGSPPEMGVHKICPGFPPPAQPTALLNVDQAEQAETTGQASRRNAGVDTEPNHANRGARSERAETNGLACTSVAVAAGLDVSTGHTGREASKGLTFSETQRLKGLQTPGLEQYQPLARRLWRPELPLANDTSSVNSSMPMPFAPLSERSGYCSEACGSACESASADGAGFGEVALESRTRRRLEATRRRLKGSETSSSGGESSAEASDGQVG